MSTRYEADPQVIGRETEKTCVGMGTRSMVCYGMLISMTYTFVFLVYQHIQHTAQCHYINRPPDGREPRVREETVEEITLPAEGNGMPPGDLAVHTTWLKTRSFGKLEIIA